MPEEFVAYLDVYRGKVFGHRRVETGHDENPDSLGLLWLGFARTLFGFELLDFGKLALGVLRAARPLKNAGAEVSNFGVERVFQFF